MEKSNEVIGVIFSCLKCVTTILSMNVITPAFKILKSLNDTGTVGGQLPWLGKRIATGIGKIETAAVELNDG